jgi:hypothetical protein
MNRYGSNSFPGFDLAVLEAHSTAEIDDSDGFALGVVHDIFWLDIPGVIAVLPVHDAVGVHTAHG